MCQTQQGNAEPTAQGTGNDRPGTDDRNHEWVRRDELTAVVAERNELKRKVRQVRQRVRELEAAAAGESGRAEELAGHAEEARRRYEQLWVDHQILTAAQAADAINGPAVVELFRRRVRTQHADDGELQAVCTGRGGEPICDDDGRAAPIAEAVRRFLAEPENAFLIRSRNPGGGGTGAGPRGVPTSAGLDQLTAEQIAGLSDAEFSRLAVQHRRDRQGFRW